MISSETWRHGPIRRYDDDRRLLEAGYRWDQLRLIEKLGLAGAGAGLICAAPFMYVSHSPQAGFACLIAGVALLALLAGLQRWPRMIVFTREGHILTPHGLPGRPFLRRLDFPHTQVVSVELTRDCRDYGVVLFTNEGRTVLLAERMFKADARLIAVQVTKALREMRESMAVIAGKRREPKEPVWIS
jgi:hypothetical protein